MVIQQYSPFYDLSNNFFFLHSGSYLYIDTMSPHSDGDAAITYLWPIQRCLLRPVLVLPRSLWVHSHTAHSMTYPTINFSFLHSGSYLYIDTLSPHSDGDAAITYSPSYDLSSDAYCAQFWYYHDGYGFITLHTRQSGVYSAPLWTSPANTVDGWRFGSGTVTGNDVQVRRFWVQTPY